MLMTSLTCAEKTWSHFKTMKWNFSHTFPYFTDEISPKYYIVVKLSPFLDYMNYKCEQMAVKMVPAITQ